MTRASKSPSATWVTVVSTGTGPWPFLPRTGWSSSPATVTSTSSSASRYSGYSSSMSSKSSAARRRTLRCASTMRPTIPARLVRSRAGAAPCGSPARPLVPLVPLGRMMVPLGRPMVFLDQPLLLLGWSVVLLGRVVSLSRVVALRQLVMATRLMGSMWRMVLLRLVLSARSMLPAGRVLPGRMTGPGGRGVPGGDGQHVPDVPAGMVVGEDRLAEPRRRPAGHAVGAQHPGGGVDRVRGIVGGEPGGRVGPDGVFGERGRLELHRPLGAL